MTFGRFTIRLVLTPFLACAALAVQSVQLGGKVSDAAGQARVGAVVVASALGAEPELFALSARATSDAQGRFQLELEPGVYTLSTIADASAPTCALSAAIQVAAGAQPAECALAPGPADLPFSGTVTDAQGRPATGALLHCQRREDGVLLHASCDEKGAFKILLPRGTWRALAATGEERSEWIDRSKQEGNKLALIAVRSPLAPPSAAVTEGLKKGLVAWKSATPTAEELAPLVAKLAGARVVGLGDALRGTHEELAFSAALFRALVEQHGFQLLVLDAPFGEIWKLNVYVLGGQGDPAELVRAISWGAWPSLELLDLVRWMRTWNEGDKHAAKLQLTGLDMLHPAAAAGMLQDYYPKVDPATGTRFAAFLGPFRQVNDNGETRYDSLDDNSRMSLKLMMMDMVGIWPDVKEDYVALSSPEEFEIAGAHLRTLSQCEEVLRLRGEGWTTRTREQHMNTNLEWALGRCGEKAKGVVLARNGVAGVSGEAEFGSLGAWLRLTYGPQYVALGLCPGRGKALLPDGTAGAKITRAAEFVLQEPRPGTLEAALASTEARAGVLDVRALAEGSAARAWLAGERVRRSLETSWTGEAGLYRRGVPGAEFELLVWMRDVTAAHPLAKN